MSNKIGRNEPCPCGSGKKYKNCHARIAAQEAAAAHAHEGAIGRAVSWLAQHHRKAFAAAVQEEIDETLFEILADEDDVVEALQRIDAELWEQMQQNFTEWLMAEGGIQVKGQRTRVSELLLGDSGPLLEVGQRAWLEQLAQRPLRLYDITEVVAGQSITLCDALRQDEAPVVVIEHAGSRSLKVGMQIGARVMAVADGHQLSGALYPFSMAAGRTLQAVLRECGQDDPVEDEDRVLRGGLMIIEHWLAQFLKPQPLPEIVDSSTGEALHFTTDHYEVRDWDALDATLAAQVDVQGDRQDGWTRLLEGDDGITRSQAVITPEAGGKRIGVMYRTAGLAERGRAWFDALAGDAAVFKMRELSDPLGMLSKLTPRDGPPPKPAPPEGIDPAQLSEALSQYVRKSYARWADEPIPALGGQTPRQAIGTEAGLERVKGLLRSYESGEADMAARDGRSAIDYQFLWDALGLMR